MARGLDNAEIAAELYLGTETVQSHVSALPAELSARDRTQAVIAAYESGFVGPGRRGNGRLGARRVCLADARHAHPPGHPRRCLGHHHPMKK